MEFIYNDEFSNGFVIEDNGDGFAVAIERVCVCIVTDLRLFCLHLRLLRLQLLHPRGRTVPGAAARAFDPRRKRAPHDRWRYNVVQSVFGVRRAFRRHEIFSRRKARQI